VVVLDWGVDDRVRLSHERRRLYAEVVPWEVLIYEMGEMGD
jgi:hypothetical protein